MQEVYREECISFGILVSKQLEYTSIEDDAKPCHPLTSADDIHVEKVRAMMHGNHFDIGLLQNLFHGC